MPRLYLYRFRYRSEIAGKWVTARYVAERHQIAARYAEWESVGPPEIRDVDPQAKYFNPWTAPRPDETPMKEPPGSKPPPQKDPPSKEPPVKEPKQIGASLEQEPQLDDLERFFARLFLRRYVTYCARRSRYGQMQGAAALYREVLGP